jgi:colicin import membrane protein
MSAATADNFFADHAKYLVAALALHVVIVVLATVTINATRPPVVIPQLAIQATIVDNSAKRIKREKEQAEAARLERERLEAEQREREQAEAQRLAEEKRAEEQREQQLIQLADEEGIMQAQNAGLLNQYMALIQQRVIRNWSKPASARPGIQCEVKVTQAPGGMVLSVQVDKCNGDAAVRQSIEMAVQRSSPLPSPPDPRLFQRVILFIFNPKE